MRTVEIHLNSQDLAEIAEMIRNESIEAPGPVFNRTLAYLQFWSLDSFPLVKIYRDQGCDLVANYFREDSTRGYTIGAVYSEGRYSFHS